ncbi:MAG: hypothetical protein HND42_02315 [Armatimonadetes bacterium]|nr:hypothetical protein [Armatimonadota bacterium]NOG92061.1 hypothetical protein [Armatimonadota bacterium]
MPYRLRALGFEGTESEDAFRLLLERLAGVGQHEGPRRIVCRPFDAATVGISLDAHGEPEAVSASLGGPLHPVMVTEVEDRPTGRRVTGFCCLDGHPVLPIRMTVTDGDFEDGTPEGMFDLSGFAERLEPSEIPPEEATAEVGSGEDLAIAAVLLSQRRVTNLLSGNSVNFVRLWMPGLVLPAALREPVEAKPGDVVAGRLRVAGCLGRAGS